MSPLASLLLAAKSGLARARKIVRLPLSRPGRRAFFARRTEIEAYRDPALRTFAAALEPKSRASRAKAVATLGGLQDRLTETAGAGLEATVAGDVTTALALLDRARGAGPRRETRFRFVEVLRWRSRPDD